MSVEEFFVENLQRQSKERLQKLKEEKEERQNAQQSFTTNLLL
jgi:hypothetical protein